MIANLLNPRLLIIGAIIALLFGIAWVGNVMYNKIYVSGAMSVQIKWDDAEKARANEIAALKLDAEKATDLIKQQAVKQQKAANEKINNLNRTIVVITNELRNRPARPTPTDSQSVSENPTAGTGATGSQLYRQDAEFLIGEAARAERVRIQLETCTNQYNAVYDAFLEFEKK